MDVFRTDEDVRYWLERSGIGVTAATKAWEKGTLVQGANLQAVAHRTAWYVDKVLKGARPGDLPIERPAKFDLGVNLKLAQQLGIEMPHAIVARATEVIE